MGSRHLLKVNPTGFPDRLEVACERKKGVKTDHKTLLSSGPAFHLRTSLHSVSPQEEDLADGHSPWRGGPLQPTDPDANRWPQKLHSGKGEVKSRGLPFQQAAEEVGHTRHSERGCKPQAWELWLGILQLGSLKEGFLGPYPTPTKVILPLTLFVVTILGKSPIICYASVSVLVKQDYRDLFPREAIGHCVQAARRIVGAQRICFLPLS